MPVTMRESLWAAYGPIMDSKALCKVFHYPSNFALNTACNRGHLPFSPVRLEHRRGIFAMTNEVADVLERAEQDSKLLSISDKHRPKSIAA